MSVKVIEDMHIKMDEMIGRVLEKLDKKSLLIIMSDHGFKSFRRGVNLNTWLHLNGYLHLKDGKKHSEEWFKDVDWPKTKAYGLGLGGIYLNLKGREAQGIVNPGEEAQVLKKEISQKLEKIQDEKLGQKAINKIFDRDELPGGPYLENCPDFIVGYNEGYRVSWDSVTGKVNSVIFEDNTKAWSGDHCIDPRIVPGIFFSTHKIYKPAPSIVDIAPSALKLFGIKPPSHMDGCSLFDGQEQ